MRSGYIELPKTAGTLRNAGHNADYWSSRGSAATNAYNLEFNTAVNPSNGPNNRWYGFPLRCLLMYRGGVPIFLLGWQEQIIATQLFYALVAAKK